MFKFFVYSASSLPCFRTEAEDLSQWQCEFRGQIRAVRQWLNSMEKMLPTLDSRVSCVYNSYGRPLFHHTSSCQKLAIVSRLSIFVCCFFILFHTLLMLVFVHFATILWDSFGMQTHLQREWNISGQQSHWPTAELASAITFFIFNCLLKQRRRECESLHSEVSYGVPPPLLQGDFLSPQGTGGGEESGSMCLDSQAGEAPGTGGPLHTWSSTLKRHQTQRRERG